MKARYILIGIILGVFIGLGLLISAWKMRPELLEIYPQPGMENVTTISPIRLKFSRSMQNMTVLDHLRIEPSVAGTFNWDKNTLTFLPNAPWPDGQEIRVSLSTGAKASSWLAFPMKSLDWSFRTTDAYLAYLWPTDGPADIYALNPGTGEIQQITRGLDVLEYTISVGGANIYFSAHNMQGGSDLYRLNRMEAAASVKDYKPELLLDCRLAQCRSPALSFDEKHLAYEYINAALGGGLVPSIVMVMNIATLAINPAGQEMHETVQPSWSSSGLLAYYDKTSSVYEIFNPQTDARVGLPNQTGQPGAWSVDGNFYLAPELSYRSADGGTESGTSHLLRYSIQTGFAQDLSVEVLVEDVEGVYSPDGNLIAFGRKFVDAERWTLGRQLWVMSSDGSNPHPLTDAPDYNHYDLAWSQDGSQIAYVRFNQARLSNPPELWMINTDGSDAIELVVGGYSPIWMP